MDMSVEPSEASTAETPSSNSAMPLTNLRGERPMGLFNLPRKVNDTIFNLAYPPLCGTQLRSRCSWERHEDSLHTDGSNYNMRDFPTVKVNDFLVSKKFFRRAASAYVGNQRIHLELIEEIDEEQPFKFGPHDKFHILREFVIDLIAIRPKKTDLVGSRPKKLSLANLPSLKYLDIGLRPSDFPSAVGYPTVWEGLFDIEDLEDLTLYKTCTGHPELRSIKAMARKFSNDSKKQCFWLGNIENFVNLVNKRLDEGRADTTSPQDEAPMLPPSFEEPLSVAQETPPQPILDSEPTISNANHQIPPQSPRTPPNKRSIGTLSSGCQPTTPNPPLKKNTLNWGSFGPSLPPSLQRSTTATEASDNGDMTCVTTMSEMDIPATPTPLSTHHHQTKPDLFEDLEPVTPKNSVLSDQQPVPNEAPIEPPPAIPNSENIVATVGLETMPQDHTTTTITNDLLDQILNCEESISVDEETLHLICKAKYKLTVLEWNLRTDLENLFLKEEENRQQELWDPGFFLLVLMFMLPWGICVGIIEAFA